MKSSQRSCWAAPGRRPTAAQLDAITVIILNYDRTSMEMSASPDT
jgi:hypothetical protein